MPELALTPNVDAACVSICCPSPEKVLDVPTFRALLCMMTFCEAFTSMSPSDSILTTLLTASSTILFFFVLSTIVTFSAPSLSSKMMR